jgi:hypothetical protein
MFITLSLWEAVRPVYAPRSCSGDAVGAYSFATWGNLEIRRRELCTACLATKACLPVTC